MIAVTYMIAVRAATDGRDYSYVPIEVAQSLSSFTVPQSHCSVSASTGDLTQKR